MALRQRTHRVLSVLLLIALAGALLPLPTAQAATTDVMSASLPSARSATAAVGLGDSVYILGGDQGSSRTAQILRYQPATDSLTAVGNLPSPRSAMSAVTDGQSIYVFGGWGDSYLDEIVRFDPATGQTTIMAATLPSARIYTSAVFDGQYAYVFGGSVSGSTTDEIVRYDPATDSVSILAGKLPSARYGTAAVFDGQYAYVFGGYSTATATQHDQVVRFDPATGTTTVLGVTLPAARYHASATFHDGKAHVYGGYDCGGGACATVFELDLAAGTASTNGTTLSSARALSSAAVVGRQAYVIGGHTGSPTAQILRFGPLGPNTVPVVDAVADVSVQATLALNLNVSASDADHEPLTLTLAPLPTGATFVDHGDGTGTFDWTPARGADGTYALTLTASDGTASDSTSFNVTVTAAPDRAPILASIADVAVTAGEPLTVPVNATDADGDPITLALTAPAGATLSDHGDGTGTISWTPVEADEGNHTFTVEATANGTTVSTAFNVTVTLAANRPPVLDAIADHDTFYGETLRITATATDADGDALTLGVSPSPLPSGATFEDQGNGTGYLNWTVGPEHDGAHTFTITATDGTNATEETFTVSVYSGPEPVIETIEDLSVSEGDHLEVPVNATAPVVQENLTLALGPQPLPFGATFVDQGNGSGVFNWNVSYAAAGVHVFTVTASNGERTTTASFEVAVANVDREPAFTTPVAKVTAGLGDVLTVIYAAADPDGSAVALAASGVPSGATFTDHGDGTATLDWADVSPVGTYSVGLTATSNGVSVTETQVIEVLRQYDVRLSAVDGSVFAMTPGETRNIQFRVTNTGVQEDTYSFQAGRLSGGLGYAVAPVPNVTLAAGASAIVDVPITAPADAHGALFRAVASSAGDAALAKAISWRVDVPVHVVVEVDESPALVGTGGASLVNGTVRLTWADGSPVVNASFEARHAYQTNSVSFETLQGTTDGSGAWTFGGEDAPAFSLPGTHFLDVGITRGSRTDTGRAVWTVSAVAVPDL